jgi:uncharacterized protein VirK/YbjX
VTHFSCANSKALFSRTDTLSGGAIQVLKRRAKFYFRHWLYRDHIAAIDNELHEQGLQALLETDPALLLRPFRSYLWTGLNPVGRAGAFVQHFRWLTQQYGSTAVLSLYRLGRIGMAQWPRDPHGVSVELLPGRALDREGELELHLLLDGVVALRTAFSILPGDFDPSLPKGNYMVIGAMQGSLDGLEVLRTLSKTMERAQPRSVFLAALQGLANGWGLRGMVGVSSKAHVFAGYGRTLARRVAVSYDEVWELAGGQHRPEATHWLLPMRPHHRDLAEIPSKKRAEHRRRDQLIEQVFEDCRAGASAALPIDSGLD